MERKVKFGLIFFAVLLAAAVIVRSESAKITNFEECEKAGWLVRSIIIYDGDGPIEKKCVLWTGKSFVKQKEVFFPTQNEPAKSQMTALLSGKPEELIIRDGCLRAGGYLLVWPYGFSLSADKDGTFRVINSTGQPVARVGDKVRIGGGGGEMSGGASGDISKESRDLPSERCSGPYWIVGEVISAEKKAISSNATVYCGGTASCETGKCYGFLHMSYAYCYEGNPCDKCPSKKCSTNQTESPIIEVICEN